MQTVIDVRPNQDDAEWQSLVADISFTNDANGRIYIEFGGKTGEEIAINLSDLLALISQEMMK